MPGAYDSMDYESNAFTPGWDLSATDSAEWAKMQPYTPAPAASANDAWWQNLVSFGVSRAIDNTLPQQYTGVQGNVLPGTFAGANGLTYYQVGPLNASPTLGTSLRSISPVWIALGCVGLYFVLKKAK